MAFAPLLATKDEIQALNVDVTAASLSLTAEKFNVIFDVIHEGIEGRILDAINRPTLTSAALSANRTMKAALKMVTIQAMANFFIWWKQTKLGKIVTVDAGMNAVLKEPYIITSEMKELLQPYKSKFAYMAVTAGTADNKEMVGISPRPCITLASDIDEGIEAENEVV